MKLLLLGASGRLGGALSQTLSASGEVVAPPRGRGPGEVELEDPACIRAAIEAVQPHVIVNAAAYTAVDAAETQALRADAVNAVAPAVLASEAARRGVWLVHFGTDHVFDGESSAPYAEDAALSPVNAYGRSKAAGEQAIRDSGCRALILRSSWLVAERGPNFVRAILDAAHQRDTLAVVVDQVGTPTSADWLARTTARVLPMAMAEPGLQGTYHAVPLGAVSRYALACHVVRWARAQGLPVKLSLEGVQAVESRNYPQAARRPLNSRLDPSRLMRTFHIDGEPWQAGVDALLSRWYGDHAR